MHPQHKQKMITNLPRSPGEKGDNSKYEQMTQKKKKKKKKINVERSTDRA